MPIWGVLAGVGPGMQSRRESDEKIAASKSRRTIAEAVEARNQRRFDWWGEQGDMLGMRPGVTPADMYKQGRLAVDDPNYWEKFEQQFIQGIAEGINNMGPTGGGIVPGAIGNNLGGVSQVPPMDMQAPALPPPEEPQQVSYTGAAEEGGFVPTSGNYQRAYAAADGGYIQVLPGAQDGGAINVPTVGQEAVGEAPVGAAPVAEQQQATSNYQAPPRRERYNKWYGQMSRLAFLNGGMDGLKQFQDLEDATSRRQALGYAQQAVTAMDEGMVGEAKRLGNTALESLSFDTGMEFVTEDGELKLQGADGSLSTSLRTADLMGFTDDWMKTPEKYLEWKQLEEEKRASMEQEEVARGQLEVNKMHAETMKGHLDIAKEKMKPEIAKLGAEVISLMQTSEAALLTAMKRGVPQGWDSSEQLRLMEQTIDLIQKDGLLGMEWMKPMLSNTGFMLPAQAGAQTLMLMNGPGTGVTTADALALTAYAYGPEVLPQEMLPDLPDSYLPSDPGEDAGGQYVTFLGKKVYVPPHMFSLIAEEAPSKEAVPANEPK